METSLIGRLYNELNALELEQEALFNTDVKFIFEKFIDFVEDFPKDSVVVEKEIQQLKRKILDFPFEEQCDNDFYLFKEALIVAEEDASLQCLNQRLACRFLKYIITKKKEHWFNSLMEPENPPNIEILEFSNWTKRLQLEQQKPKATFLFYKENNLPSSDQLQIYLDAIYKMDPLTEGYLDCSVDFMHDFIFKVLQDKKTACTTTFLYHLDNFYKCLVDIQNRYQNIKARYQNIQSWSRNQQIYIEQLIYSCEKQKEECITP